MAWLWTLPIFCLFKSCCYRLAAYSMPAFIIAVVFRAVRLPLGFRLMRPIFMRMFHFRVLKSPPLLQYCYVLLCRIFVVLNFSQLWIVWQYKQPIRLISVPTLTADWRLVIKNMTNKGPYMVLWDIQDRAPSLSDTPPFSMNLYVLLPTEQDLHRCHGISAKIFVF